MFNCSLGSQLLVISPLHALLIAAMKYYPNNLKQLVLKLLGLWWVSAYALMFYEHKSSLAHINREKVSKYFSTIHNAVNYFSKIYSEFPKWKRVLFVRAGETHVCLSFALNYSHQWAEGSVVCWVPRANDTKAITSETCEQKCLLFVVCRLRWGGTFENGFGSWYAPIENLPSPR